MKDWRALLRWRLLQNFPLKILALVLASVLVLLKFEDKPSELVLTIPVRVNVPENKMLVSPVVDKVQVTIKGRYGHLRQLKEERRKELQIALSRDDVGQYTFDPKAIEMPPELSVASIHPPVMLVRLDDRVEATLPLKVDLEGTPRSGYRLAESRLDPATVRVAGAAQAVAALKAVPTERVSLVGRSTSTSFNVPLATPPPHVQWLDESQTYSLSLVIEEIQEEREFRRVPIVVVNTESEGPDYEAVPGTMDVRLFGPVRALDNLTSERLVPRVEIHVRAPGRPTLRDRKVLLDLPDELSLVGSRLEEVTLLRREAPPSPPALPVPLGPVPPGSATSAAASAPFLPRALVEFIPQVQEAEGAPAGAGPSQPSAADGDDDEGGTSGETEEAPGAHLDPSSAHKPDASLPRRSAGTGPKRRR